MAKGYTPDTRQRLARATRFFARLRAFDIECPRCGTIYKVRIDPKPHPAWDPLTGRFTCTMRTCGKTYILGILAWGILPTRNVASATPADQVPDPRQLAKLRSEGGGWWMPDDEAQRYVKPLETNLTDEPDRPEED